jgi:hypothetical protein
MKTITITSGTLDGKYQSGDITKTDYLKIAFWLQFGVGYEKLCDEEISLFEVDRFCEEWSIEPDKEAGVKGLQITREDVLKRIGKLITIKKKDDPSIIEKLTGHEPKSIQLELFNENHSN